MFVFCFGGTAPSNLLQTAQDVTMHVENGRCTNAADLVSKWRSIMRKNWGLRLENSMSEFPARERSTGEVAGKVYWLSVTDHVGQRGKASAMQAIMADKIGKDLLGKCFKGYEDYRREY